jgi:hypothetical protein
MSAGDDGLSIDSESPMCIHQWKSELNLLRTPMPESDQLDPRVDFLAGTVAGEYHITEGQVLGLTKGSSVLQVSLD